MKNIKRGQIFMADLNPIRGHEQGGYRPVLIIQKDVLNKHLNTVVIAPITKNMKAKGFLTTCFLDKKISHLKFDSVALLFQIRTIDKGRLVKPEATLSPIFMSQVREQLLMVI
jgi:mRNA interferase MazF